MGKDCHKTAPRREGFRRRPRRHKRAPIRINGKSRGRQGSPREPPKGLTTCQEGPRGLKRLPRGRQEARKSTQTSPQDGPQGPKMAFRQPRRAQQWFGRPLKSGQYAPRGSSHTGTSAAALPVAPKMCLLVIVALGTESIVLSKNRGRWCEDPSDSAGVVPWERRPVVFYEGSWPRERAPTVFCEGSLGLRNRRHFGEDGFKGFLSACGLIYRGGRDRVTTSFSYLLPYSQSWPIRPCQRDAKSQV